MQKIFTFTFPKLAHLDSKTLTIVAVLFGLLFAGDANAQNTSPLNYVQTTVYGDEDEKVIGQSIQYYDKLGRQTQSLSKNISDNRVLISEIVYDDFGRPVITTFPAPVNQGTLEFDYDFVDLNQLLNGGPLAATDHLGWYYSNSNIYEFYVPADAYPYSKVVYSKANPGAVRQSYMAGAATKDKFTTGFTVSASPDELFEHDLKGKVNLKTLKAGTHLRTDFIGMTKSVSIDVMEKEAITYFDAEGRTIASCMSSATPSESNLVTYEISINSEGTGYIDIHLPAGPANYTIQKTALWESQVIDLITDDTVVSPVTSENLPPLIPGVYRIKCTDTKNFTVISFMFTMGYKYYSFSAYDIAGRLTRTLSPLHAEKLEDGSLPLANLEDHVRRNTYNALGWLLNSFSSDEGTTDFKYRKDGKIRFSQNAEQDDTNTFSYTNYDKHGRVVEVGEYDETGGITFSDITAEQLKETHEPGAGLDNNTNKHFHVTCTYYGSTADPDAPNGESPQFTWGKVARTSNDNVTTWYNYNYDGSIAWAVQQVKDLDADGDGDVDNDDLITLHYTYDFTGNVTEVVFRKGFTDQLSHYYEYDADNRLKAVYTRYGLIHAPDDVALNSSLTAKSEVEALKTITIGAGFSSNNFAFSADVIHQPSKKLHANYDYYQHGPLKRVEIGANQEQGVDYVYNINGLLKSINNPNGIDPGADGYYSHNPYNGKDIFAMALDYYNGDYTRSGKELGNSAAADNFDGTISQQRYKNNKLDDGLASGSQNAWRCTYNERNFLATAGFGSVDVSTNTYTSAVNNAYAVFGTDPGTQISYDANGNIVNLARNMNGGTLMDKFTYNYHATKPNRLLQVTDNSLYTELATGDLKDQTATDNYTYNDIGQLTWDKTGQDGTGHRFTYDVYGKVTDIKNSANGAIAQYVYDDRGFRVKKVDSLNHKTTWYARDLSGTIMATYETIGTTTALKEMPIYGSGRLGLINVSGSQTNYTYELTDHLGNVRATFSPDGAGDANTEPDILFAQDYYPFGMEMPGRKFSSEDYRFGYQGQFAEKDEETGYNQFELRLYDARIGRWLSTDPYRQFYSLYRTGNNPISSVDPDGGVEPWFRNDNWTIFVRGVTELPEEYKKLYGDDLVKFGEDDMINRRWSGGALQGDFYAFKRGIFDNVLMPSIGYKEVPTTGWEILIKSWNPTSGMGALTSEIKEVIGERFTFVPINFEAKAYAEYTKKLHGASYGGMTLSFNYYLYVPAPSKTNKLLSRTGDESYKLIQDLTTGSSSSTIRCAPLQHNWSSFMKNVNSEDWRYKGYRKYNLQRYAPGGTIRKKLPF